MRISSYSFISILLKLHRCFAHGLKICMCFRYNPQIIFYHFFCKLNLVIFQALLLSTYVDSMYLVRVTPLMNFTFLDDSLCLKKNLGRGHKFSEFACFLYYHVSCWKLIEYRPQILHFMNVTVFYIEFVIVILKVFW